MPNCRKLVTASKVGEGGAGNQMKNYKSKNSCNKVPTEIHDRAKQIASVLMKSKKPITNEWLKKEVKKMK